MKIHFLRHATFVAYINGATLLADPMLSPAGALPPIQNTANARPNPLVNLPLDDLQLRDLLARLDGVIVTHTHRDHWDARAVELLPKHLPILCQPDDAARIEKAGFTRVQPIAQEMEWRGLRVARTGGQHGTGEIGKQMAPVSGFVLRAKDAPVLYIAGDTIWCPEVADALQTYRPGVVVVNAGAARFLTGDPITMTAEDVAPVCRALSSARVIAVHMEAINHCGLTRDELRRHLDTQGLRAEIPADGALIEFK